MNGKIKKIAFLGDSITAGAWVTKEEIYLSRVGAALGVQVQNLGVSGTRIAKQSHHVALHPDAFDEEFLVRAKRIDGDADFVFVFGGTNDYGHGDADLGELGDATPYTFFGAAKLLTDYLVSAFGREKVCFLLPLPRVGEERPDGDGVPYKTKSVGPLLLYVRALMQVLDSVNVDYIDLRGVFPPEKLSALTADGLHPNAEGHKLIADEIIKYLRGKGCTGIAP